MLFLIIILPEFFGISFKKFQKKQHFFEKCDFFKKLVEKIKFRKLIKSDRSETWHASIGCRIN